MNNAAISTQGHGSGLHTLGTAKLLRRLFALHRKAAGARGLLKEAGAA
jgi:hypothetical protein